MNDAKQELIDEIHQDVDEILAAQVEVDRRTRKYESDMARLADEYAADVAPYQSVIDQKKPQLREKIVGNFSILKDDPKRASFSTERISAIERSYPVKVVVTDKSGLMSKARDLGVVKSVAKLKHFYELNLTKLKDFIAKNPKYRKELAPFMEEVPAHKVLSIHINTGHSGHDPKRFTKKAAITIDSLDAKPGDARRSA